MSIGGICLAYAGFALFLSSDDVLGTWGSIVPYLIIFGIGRGTWENTNKAIVADLYTETPDLSTSAFASIAFFNGLAGMFISDEYHTYYLSLFLLLESDNLSIFRCYSFLSFCEPFVRNLIISSSFRYSLIIYFTYRPI